MCNPGFLSYALYKELMGQNSKMLKHRTKNNLTMDLNGMCWIASLTSLICNDLVNAFK